MRRDEAIQRPGALLSQRLMGIIGGRTGTNVAVRSLHIDVNSVDPDTV